MRRRLVSFFLLGITVLHAQVEREDKSPGIEVGLVGQLDHTNRQHDDGDVLKSFVRVMQTEDLSLKHFSVSFQLFTEGSQIHDVVSLIQAEHFKLELEGGKNLQLQLTTPSGGELKLSTPLLANVPSKPEMHHIVLRVQRDTRQALTGLWIDGIEVVTGQLIPGAIPLKKNSLVVGDEALRGVIVQARLYDRVLTRPEILELGQKHPEKPKASPKGMYDFEVQKDEIIAVLGGTEAVAVMEEGSLESLIMQRYAAQHPKMRTLAWETDTVFRQDRPMNFGDLRQQLQRSEATCVMLLFGRQECLERGADGLPEFRAALDRMVKTCASITPRLVLVEAAPFEKKTEPLPDLSLLNPILARYNEVIGEVAEANAAYFAVSKEGWNHFRPQPMTQDGVNLTQTGARELGLRILTTSNLPVREDAGELMTLIKEKNRLWHDYWRPSNWAFLFGDRTAQPSSRDHLDPSKRWFPAELENYRALIDMKEQEIWKKAEALRRKVP